MRGFVKVLLGVLVISTASNGYAALPSTPKVVPEIPIGKALAFNRSTGEFCQLGERNTGDLKGALIEKGPHIKGESKEIVRLLVKQKSIAECSPSIRAGLETVTAGIENGTRTAIAPVIYGLVGAYAACTAVNVVGLGDSISSSMTLGGRPDSTTAEKISMTICFPVTVSNIAILYVGVRAMEYYENLMKKEPAQENRDGKAN